MTNYKKIYVSIIDNKIIDETYKNLLENKWHFVILDVNGVLNVLTKEKSLFNINNEQQFINDFKQDIYYKTINYNKKRPSIPIQKGTKVFDPRCHPN